jgi:hypothetical protein
MSISHANLSNYDLSAPGTYFQRPANFYTSMAGSTTSPNSPMMVLNPYDPPTKAFYQAFNSGLLNPYQNAPVILPRPYYTISTAYGPPPVQTQIQRSCSGLLRRPAGM